MVRTKNERKEGEPAMFGFFKKKPKPGKFGTPKPRPTKVVQPPKQGPSPYTWPVPPDKK